MFLSKRPFNTAIFQLSPQNHQINTTCHYFESVLQPPVNPQYT